MSDGRDRPQLLHTAIDTTDARGLAEFYRELLGLRYRDGDEPPADGTGRDGAGDDAGHRAGDDTADQADWLVLVDDAGTRQLAFQRVERLTPTTWPEHDVPMQLHLDFTVADTAALHRHRARAEALGARLLLDRTDDPDEALFVLADPAGHPFCLLVG